MLPYNWISENAATTCEPVIVDETMELLAVEAGPFNTFSQLNMVTSSYLHRTPRQWETYFQNVKAAQDQRRVESEAEGLNDYIQRLSIDESS